MKLLSCSLSLFITLRLHNTTSLMSGGGREVPQGRSDAAPPVTVMDDRSATRGDRILSAPRLFPRRTGVTSPLTSEGENGALLCGRD
ncbi:hypothetical protein AVEN_205478-1 [Araneus ventricosus]|uniref:Secreted protein n=1 Tax=Araneus ventricosus TaxID=182803 RepID=A0A4Y2CC50_ARAVE|nr:hypothetical protein AVEN_205478-1 [Araneus ventricosus]